MARSMTPASARHGIRSPKEVGEQASLGEIISLLKQSAAEINAQVSLDTKIVMELLDLCYMSANLIIQWGCCNRIHSDSVTVMERTFPTRSLNLIMCLSVYI